MNDRLKTKYLESIDQLLDLAYALCAQLKETSEYDVANFASLQTGGESLILKLVGENSPYYKNFQYIMMSNQDEHYKVSACLGVLARLKTELDQGLLGEVEDLVRAEVFTDFLEIAHHLLETGYKDPAATLVGGVLENGLKKLSEEKEIQYKNNDGIGALNKGLAKAKVYTHLKQQQVQAWAAIRNSAAHGNTDEYNADDVKYMLDGVQNFLTEHLG